MVAGLMDGLDHEESANFAFLLATPVIFLAGILKLPDLMGPLGDGVRYQTLVGSLCAMVTALISVKFLTKWFTTKTLIPRFLQSGRRTALRHSIRLVRKYATAVDGATEGEVIGELQVAATGSPLAG